MEKNYHLPNNTFCPKISSAYYHCSIYLNALQTTFIMYPNNMHPGENFDVCPYCLQYGQSQTMK